MNTINVSDLKKVAVTRGSLGCEGERMNVTARHPRPG